MKTTTERPVLVVINGVTYELFTKDRIGSGGQADVYRIIIDGTTYAYKHFFTQRTAKVLLDKIVIMQQAKAKIPVELVWPIEVGYTLDNAVDGYLAPLLERREFISIANWTRDKRKTKRKLSTVLIALINLYKLVQSLNDLGIILADMLTYHNVFFNRKGEIRIVDTDSVEMPEYAIHCLAYSPPLLPYEFDMANVATGKAFSKVTDNYAFISLLFYIIYSETPFGGIHPNFADDTYFERGRAGAWLFDGVSETGNATQQELASIELFEFFKKTFAKGAREALPMNLLEDFLLMLIKCKSEECGREYPNDLDICPHCGASNLTEALLVELEEEMPDPRRRIISLGARILGTVPIGQKDLLVFSNQHDGFWCHRISDNKVSSCHILQVKMPVDSQFWGIGNVVAIGQPESGEVVFLDFGTLQNSMPSILGSVDGCARSLTYSTHNEVVMGELLFAKSGQRFFYISGDTIKVVRIFQDKINSETWATIQNPQDVSAISVLNMLDKDSPILVTYLSGIAKLIYKDGREYRISLPKKPSYDCRLAQVLLDNAPDALLIRRIYHGTKSYVSSILIGLDGKVIWHKDELLSSYPSMADIKQNGLFGKAGEDYVLIHLTPQAVVQERILTGKRIPILATMGLVQSQSKLIWYQGKFALITKDVIYSIPISDKE